MAKKFNISLYAKRIWMLFIYVGLLSGCIESRKVAVVEALEASWFSGVKSARNLGGIPSSIKVEWNKADRTVLAYRIYALLEDPVTKITDWVLLEEVTNDITSYIHSNLNSGQIYSYKVKAVDSKDVEDTNTIVASSVAFEGIGSVTITGKTTASITLVNSTGSFDEVRVYAIPKTGGTKQLVGTGKGNVSVINASGLKSGTTYKFYTNVYISYIKAEDGNESYIEAQTHSHSFGTGESNDTSYEYQGVLNIQAFGSAPNAPQNPTTAEDSTFSTNFPDFLENPQNRRVRFTWLPFLNSGSTTKYKVVRTSGSNNLDMSTQVPCTDSINSSCVICTVTGSGTQRCEDLNVAAPPKTYNYAVSLVKSDETTSEEWVEELPTVNTSDFKIKVHIPPDYMVLVQRNAANYEMCQNMGRTSNPRKWQRCTYTGIGATPYSTGPGKPPLTMDVGYYDQGYNFFVDRYRTACNWTRTAGACGNPQGCVAVTSSVGVSAPSDLIGIDGNVFYVLDLNGPNCYYKKAGSWKALKDSSLTLSELRAATSVDPGINGLKHKIGLNHMTAGSGFNICQSYSNEYGSKRLLRRREYLTAAAFPLLPGEPNELPDMRSRISVEHGSVGKTEYECQGSTDLVPKTTTIPNLVSTTNTRATFDSSGTTLFDRFEYFIGTQQTIRCQTRWGSQDFVAKAVGAQFSDTFTRMNGTAIYPMTLRGDSSDYDNGARDFLGFEFGTGTGPSWGTMAQWYSNTIEDSVTSNTNLGTSYVIPLGIPILSWNLPSAQDLWSKISLDYAGLFGGNRFSQGGNDTFRLTQNNGTRFYMTEGDSGRWGATIYSDGASYHTSIWCAQEAE